MVVGSGVRGKGGAVLLYQFESDFAGTGITCIYLHKAPGMAKDVVNPVDSGDMWECPRLFPDRR